jgi:hypothetical protein
MGRRIHDPECPGTPELALSMEDFTWWLRCPVCGYQARHQGDTMSDPIHPYDIQAAKARQEKADLAQRTRQEEAR